MSVPIRAAADLERDRFLAHAEQLAQLVAHPSWQAYTDLLAGMRLAALEEMAKAGPDEFRFWQGWVGALAEMISRPQQIVDTAQVVQEDEAAADPAQIRAALRALMMNDRIDGDL